MDWQKTSKKTAKHCLVIKEYDEKTSQSRIYPLFFNTEKELESMADELKKRKKFQTDMLKATVTGISEPCSISTIERIERSMSAR